MDALHRSDEFPFISDVIDIRQFFEDGVSLKEEIVGVNNEDTDDSEKLAQRIGCNEATFKELEDLCNPERLKCGEEDEDNPLSDKIPSSGRLHLDTLEIQQRELKKRQDTLSYRQMVCQLHKYKRTNFRVLDAFRFKNEVEINTASYIPPDVVLTIALTKPYNRVLEYHEIRLGRLLSLDSSFCVLGSTPLTALRDKISCVCDWSVMRDCSENPDTAGDVLAKEKYKSAFFYINGVFYNDTRDPASQDISQPVLDWAVRRGDELGPFTTASMADTHFIDLKLRLGQPYMYLHQGTCEHLIIFTDLRMISSTDSQNPEDYPLLISLKPKKRVPCCACKVYTAKWVVYGHTEIPGDPSFFCDPCYRAFHYDEQGRKTGDYQATPYCDRSVLA